MKAYHNTMKTSSTFQLVNAFYLVSNRKTATSSTKNIQKQIITICEADVPKWYDYFEKYHLLQKKYWTSQYLL